MRRRLKEALKAILREVELQPAAKRDGAPSFDLIVIARPEAAEADYWQLKRALKTALGRSGVLV